MGFTHWPTGHASFAPFVRLGIRRFFGRLLAPFPDRVGFFAQTVDRFGPDTFGGLLCDEMSDLLPILRVLCDVLLPLRLCGDGELGRTSTSFVLIQPSETSRVPGIQPVRERQTRPSKNLHAFMRGHALETQQKTMGTLPDTMMWTVLRQSTEYVLGFRASILHASHRQACPVCRGFSEKRLSPEHVSQDECHNRYKYFCPGT
jgi:hypothetical protein